VRCLPTKRQAFWQNSRDLLEPTWRNECKEEVRKYHQIKLSALKSHIETPRKFRAQMRNVLEEDIVTIQSIDSTLAAKILRFVTISAYSTPPIRFPPRTLMKLNDSRPSASGKEDTAHRHDMTEKKPPLPAGRTLDPFEAEGPASLTAEKVDRALRLDDFVFLSEGTKCWLIRTADIWLLEACADHTRIYLPDGTALVRRPLRDCQRRLDSSTFFRATRDCVINLTQVKQTRLLDCAHILFVLPNGKEVIVSGKQNLLFRRRRAL
jgi:LytTr DNA-binding domain